MHVEKKTAPAEAAKQRLAILLNFHRIAVSSGDAALRAAMQELEKVKAGR